MTDLRRAAEMAVKALKNKTTVYVRWDYGVIEATKVMQEALDNHKLAEAFADDFPNTWGKKKHTSLPKREWVELTKDDVDSWPLLESPTVYEFSKYVEAKLKAKNDFNFTQS